MVLANFRVVPDNLHFVDQKNRERAEAWLRYADDIGLGPFYTARYIPIATRSAVLHPPKSEAYARLKS